MYAAPWRGRAGVWGMLEKNDADGDKIARCRGVKGRRTSPRAFGVIDCGCGS